MKNFLSRLRYSGSYKTKYRLSVSLVILITLLLSIYVAPSYYNQGVNWLNAKTGINLPQAPKKPFRLGLDLQGGTHLVYEADLSQIKGGESEKIAALEGVRDVIERRVNAFGVSEPIVQTNHSGDKWRLIVELAGVHDVNKAIKMIGETPILEFKLESAESKRDLSPEEKKEMEEYNKKALEKAKKIIKELKKDGSNFDELAKKYSEDPGTKDKGGELGFAKRGMMVPEFEKAIFDNLKVGEFTKKPVKTQFGYHIILKEEVKGGPKPDGSDDTEVRAKHILIRTKSKLDYVDSKLTWKNTGLSGKQLVKSQVQFDPNTNEPQVALVFNDEGKKLFASITKTNIGKRLAIFLDGSPISTPVIREEIRDGKAVISGNFDIKEAKLLAQRLNAGALPVPIKLISQNTVGASLGKISLEKSLKAGFYGLLLIILFLIIIYRFYGLTAAVALLVYGILTLATFKFFGITITLAGLSGLILSIGMAVDANVLIFERMKEEKKIGKKGMQLIDDGFNRAWPSIRDGNVSTLLTSLILIWFSTSMVKGFAITLSIGILISMFSAIVVTRLLLKSFIKN